MTGKLKNMDNYLLDFKVFLVWIWCAGLNLISDSKFTTAFSFVFVSLFTLRRWYLMEKRNKKDSK